MTETHRESTPNEIFHIGIGIKLLIIWNLCKERISIVYRVNIVLKYDLDCSLPLLS